MKNSFSTTMFLIPVATVLSLLVIGCGDASHDEGHKGHDHSKHEGHEHHDHSGHDHAKPKNEKKHDPLVVGPRGGKVFSHPGHLVELWVDEKRHVHVSSLDENGSKTQLKDFSISAICGDRANPSKMSFNKSGDEWVSDKALPDGKNIPFVLTTESKGKTFLDRIDLKLWNCSGCDLMEYACTCTH